MNVLDTALRRPFTILVIVTAIALAAGLAIQRMSRDIFPPLGVPRSTWLKPMEARTPLRWSGYLHLSL